MSSLGSDLYAVILAGGSGTRFWPLSREFTPKQMLSLIGTRSLFQETLLHTTSRDAAGFPRASQPLRMTCEDFYRCSWALLPT